MRVGPGPPLLGELCCEVTANSSLITVSSDEDGMHKHMNTINTAINYEQSKHHNETW